jgi:hypothetical protein
MLVPQSNPFAFHIPPFIDWLDTPHPSQHLHHDCSLGHKRTSTFKRSLSALGQERKCRISVAQKKSRPKAASQFKLMLADQAAINTGFDFRR